MIIKIRITWGTRGGGHPRGAGEVLTGTHRTAGPAAVDTDIYFLNLIKFGSFKIKFFEKMKIFF